ncbi:hypothetical protein AKJ49_00875 [candidate division MSBL1 archaeon SCGC-AAA382A03]|uniref:UspA domain-containing protein n=1 Tax=candidate division MSBL1 archaeon SCGC-AAA382A03 TaxID=1698278 RepID=A0A133VG35_9EURY|nr:hypothetical protein AKJ49_00875 [candidate division MSBL1 archaeon SCGC-AAA382A03]
MSDIKKVENILIPFSEVHPPGKAYDEARKYLKKGGTLYLLHILDDASTRSVRYMTELGEESEVVKSFQKAQKDLQEGETEDFAEKEEGKTEEDFSIKTKFIKGDPAEEVLKAIEEYSIDLAVVEQLRQKKDRILFGDEVDFFRKKAPCKVITI